MSAADGRSASPSSSRPLLISEVTDRAPFWAKPEPLLLSRTSKAQGHQVLFELHRELACLEGLPAWPRLERRVDILASHLWRLAEVVSAKSDLDDFERVQADLRHVSHLTVQYGDELRELRGNAALKAELVRVDDLVSYLQANAKDIGLKAESMANRLVELSTATKELTVRGKAETVRVDELIAQSQTQAMEIASKVDVSRANQFFVRLEELMNTAEELAAGKADRSEVKSLTASLRLKAEAEEAAALRREITAASLC